MDTKLIDELSGLELRAIDGETNALCVFMLADYKKLMRSPVQVAVADVAGIDADLHDMVKQLAGDYIQFIHLRQKTNTLLHERSKTKGPLGWMALTTLFNGIYVGDASDILRVRNGVPPLDFGQVQATSITQKEGHTYITHADGAYQAPSGIGKKVADVQFLDTF